MDPFERAAQRELVARDEAHRLGFRLHLMIYVAVQALLIATWWFTSDGGRVLPWFIFPMVGWGIGVLAHYVGLKGRRRLRRD